MPTPLVTILIPVFNAEKYLGEAMQSLVSQTYTHLEILCIDDGSTDSSGKLLDQWALKDLRVKVIHIENHGIVYALNLGLQSATGTLIARMDADDVCAHDRIEKQVAYLERYPEIGMLGNQVQIISEEGYPIRECRFALSHDDIEGSLLKGMCQLSHSSIIVRKEIFEKLEGYHPCAAEDYDLYLRASECTQLANLTETLVHYRSTLAGLKQSSLAKNQQSVLESLRQGLERRKLPPQLMDEVKAHLDQYVRRMQDPEAFARKQLKDAWFSGNVLSTKYLGRKLWKRRSHDRKTFHRWIKAEICALFGGKNQTSAELFKR